MVDLELLAGLVFLLVDASSMALLADTVFTKLHSVSVCVVAVMADWNDVRSMDWWEANSHADSANMGRDCGAVGAWHHHRRTSMHCNSRLSVHRPTWVSWHAHWLTRVWLAWHSHGLAGVWLAWHRATWVSVHWLAWHWLSWHSHGLARVWLAWHWLSWHTHGLSGHGLTGVWLSWVGLAWLLSWVHLLV